MIAFVEGLGAWAWWIGGVILLALEIVAPGNIFVWFGLAAILTGVVAMFGDVSWQVELLIFGVLSLVLVIAGRRYFARRSGGGAEPFLNQRLDGMVGRDYVISEPIVDGVGHVRVNDANWRITGPDLPSGARVKVVGHDGAVLTVVATE